MTRLLFAVLLVASMFPATQFAVNSEFKYVPIIVAIMLLYIALLANTRIPIRIDRFVITLILYSIISVLSGLANYEYGAEAAFSYPISIVSTIGLTTMLLYSQKDLVELRRYIYTFCLVIQGIALLTIVYLLAFPRASMATHGGDEIVLAGVPILQSFWGNQNVLAEVLMWSVFCAVALYYISNKRFWILAGIACTFVVAFTASRAAFIALTVFLLGALRGRYKLLFIVITSLMISGALSLFEEQVGEYFRLGHSDRIRIDFIESGLNAFTFRPWLGYGPGNASLAMEIGATTPEVALLAQYYSPHNLYVRVLAELGILGFATWMYSVVYALQHALRSLRVGHDLLLKTMVTFLAAVLVHRLFHHGLPGGVSYDNLFPLLLVGLIARYSQLAHA